MITIIFGPPGTGKTTSQLKMVETHLSDGIPPENIAYLGFTRRAANEAKERAMEKFKLEEHQLPWFRTIHSLAFQQLGLNKNSVMSLSDYKKICDILGLTISYKINDDGTFMGQTKGDRLFHMENIARVTKLSIENYWELLPDEDISFQELKLLHDTLTQYKHDNSKLDFTDMMVMFAKNPVMPPLRVLIVDEAQDLSPIQWDIVKSMMREVEQVYIAGDDDQAIFRWAGADVDTLMSIEGDTHVLSQSYRIPANIQKVANDVVSRISKRIEKHWKPRDFDGSVEHITDIEQVDMSSGTWLLLARNAYLLDIYCEHCIRSGLLFDSQRESPIKSEAMLAIREWEKLRSGNLVPASSVKKIYDMMSIRTGISYGYKSKLNDLPNNKLLSITELKTNWGLITDSPWNIALDKLTGVELEYYLTAEASGDLITGPRIRISTIHGAKGGEAQNVVIMTNMASRTYREMENNPDDEHRVFYVGVTRAKENLYIIQPTTNYFYDI